MASSMVSFPFYDRKYDGADVGNEFLFLSTYRNAVNDGHHNQPRFANSLPSSGCFDPTRIATSVSCKRDGIAAYLAALALGGVSERWERFVLLSYPTCVAQSVRFYCVHTNRGTQLMAQDWPIR